MAAAGDTNTREIRFAPDFGECSGEITLVAVTEDLLSKLLAAGGAAVDGEGEGVTLKGRDEDEAVLCMNDSTYDIKLAEASNTLLLVPPKHSREALARYHGEQTYETRKRQRLGEADPAATSAADTADSDATSDTMVVVSSVENCLQLLPIPPRLNRLKHLLNPATGGGASTAYRGPQNEDEVDRSLLVTRAQVEQETQASCGEIKKALLHEGALEIDGHCRVLDVAYSHQIIRQLLSLQIEHEWPSAAVPVEACVELLGKHGYPASVVRHALAQLSTTKGDLEGAERKLDERKVGLWWAQQILTAQAKPKGAVTFMQEWAGEVPADMSPPDVDLLKAGGFALLDAKDGLRPGESPDDVDNQLVHYFPTSKLSGSARERLKQLFERRPKWLVKDIEPFLTDLQEDPKKLLRKFTNNYENDAKERVVVPRRGL